MTKRTWFPLLILLATPACFAQTYTRYDNIVLGPRGPIPNATIAVCTQPAVTSTMPCSPLATIYSSSNGAAQANPLTADVLGNYHFYANGIFTIQVYGPQILNPFIMTDVITNTDNRVHAERFPGADPCAQITNAVNALPSTGGVIDATAYQGTQTACAAGFTLSKPLTLLFGPATFPLGSNSINITSDAVDIQGVPGFNTSKGTYFTYTGTACAICLNSGGSGSLYNDIILGVTIVASQGAVSSTSAVGIYAQGLRYSHFSDVSTQGFAADIGIAYQATSGPGLSATNMLDNPQFFNNKIGLYTAGTGGGTSSQLVVRGGFILCNAIVGSVGIQMDVTSILNQVWGTDIENCSNAVQLISASSITNNIFMGVHSESITGTHYLIGAQAVNTQVTNPTFAGGGTHFSGPAQVAGAGLLSSGAVAPVGCSLSTSVGDALSGQFNSGTTGTCTVVITPGWTAFNGWHCDGIDFSTGAVLLKTSSNTTTCTISGTTTSGNFVSWRVTQY